LSCRRQIEESAATIPRTSVNSILFSLFSFLSSLSLVSLVSFSFRFPLPLPFFIVSSSYTVLLCWPMLSISSRYQAFREIQRKGQRGAGSSFVHDAFGTTNRAGGCRSPPPTLDIEHPRKPSARLQGVTNNGTRDWRHCGHCSCIRSWTLLCLLLPSVGPVTKQRQQQRSRWWQRRGG
jgi:hypothetical protein